MAFNLHEIIKECKKNDRKAQSALFETYRDTLFYIALKYSRNTEDAEDVLHDAFMTIFGKIRTYKGSGSFEGWMKRITTFKAIDYYKNRKEFPTEELPETTENTEIDTKLLELPLEILLSFVQELPDRYRLVFNLYQMDGHSHKEISELLNISEGTSKSNYHRAKQQLKKHLIEYTNQVPLKNSRYGS